MRTIRIGGPRWRHNTLHVEAPGCIINITVGLADAQGRGVTRVDVNANGDRYAGDPQWWVEGQKGNRGLGLRIIRTTEG